MKRGAVKRARLVVEEFEPRILYSADAGVLTHPDALAPAAEVRVLDVSVAAPAAATSADPAALPAAPAPAGEGTAAVAAPSAAAPATDREAAVRHELVFVDTSVNDYQKLLDQLIANAGTDRQFAVVLINPDANGIEQVTQALAAQPQQVDAVHFITHGTDGAVKLGNVWLNDQNLDAYAASIANWRQGFASNADLLFYGCDVADNADGRALVDALHTLTGANVAASADLTGNAALGGNWNLEYTAGTIATTALFLAPSDQAWSGMLATLTVSTTADVVDGNTASIATLLANKGADGRISLREAIIAANNTPGRDEIDFNIGAGGLQTISPAAGGLPAITDAVIIDATTQPGYAGTPLIQISGSLAGSGADGLHLGAGSSGSVIRGLIVNNFNNRAILIDGGSGNNLVAGNYLGTDATGLVDLGNAAWGIDIISGGSNNVIGGSTAADRNVISGNDLGGIALNGAAVTNTRVQGNYIGVGADGTTAIGNGPGYGGGILVLNNSTGATIGGTAAGEGNIIANNQSNGVNVWQGSARIVGNSIYNNVGLGIDLNNNGVTFNDLLDFDFGPNNLQNFPVLTSALVAPGQITVAGTLNSAIGNAYTIDFYASPSKDPSGYGEGKVYLGSTSVTTDLLGNASFNAVLGVSVSSGAWISATATDSANNTSEFALSIFTVGINQPPVGASKTVTTLEDAAYTFAAADFGFSDPNDNPPNALLNVKITTLPAAGSLKLSGVAVSAGQFVSAANIAAGNLKFTPAANANGAGYASFTFRVQDDGGTANGGVNLDATARTLTVNVTAVNDAPVGTNKTVTALEDTAYAFTAADFGFTDPTDAAASAGANALLNVKIATLPAAGSLKLSGVAVSAGQFVSAANITAGNLKFTPAANVNGAGSASFTFQVQDSGGTANGGVDLDATPRTMTVDVTAVNDAPVRTAGAVNNLTLPEDSAATSLGLGTLAYAPGPANESGQTLSYKVTGVPAAALGTVTLADGITTVTANTAYTLAQLQGMKFKPMANANGGPAAFSWTVKDSSGTANGGIDTLTESLNVNVTSVNDAPVGTSKTVTGLEDTAYTFTTADFGFTDPTDAAAAAGANALLNVKITTSPAAGSLKLSGVAVSAGQFVSGANIAAGNLTFTPAANANGMGYTSFTFQVQDDGGTANGGVNLDATPRTMTVNVTASNDAPVLSGANNLSSLNEDPASNAGTLVSALIAGKVNDIDGGALTGIAVTAVNNGNGTWQYSMNGGGAWNNFGTPSTTAARLLAADANTYVRFVPNANWNGTVTNGIAFQAWDQSSGTAGGTASLTAASSTVLDQFSSNSYANNDGSTNWAGAWVENDSNGGGASGGRIRVTGGEVRMQLNAAGDWFYRQADLSGATSATLSMSYSNANGNGDVVAIQVSGDGGSNYTTLDSFSNSLHTGAGTLSLDITPFIATNTRVRFLIAANSTGGNLYLDNIGISFGTAITGGTSAFSSAMASASVTVNPVNDAPVGTNKTVTTLEDTAYAFTAADFGFTDPADAAAAAGANALLNVKIGTLPAAGSLNLAGVAVSAGQSVSAANITAGNLTFTPAANANCAGYTSFTFQVQDDGGTANGGIDLDATPRTMTVNVTAVNDAPQGTNTTVTTLEDTAYTFGTADFGLTDPVDAPANNLLNVRITAPPATGSLELSGVAVSAGQFVSAANIAAGNLKFMPAANANGAANASFTFQVQDDGGTAYGGTDIDVAPRTMTVNVTAVNDAPVTAIPGAQIAASNTPLVFSLAGGNSITVADIDAGASPVQVTLTAGNATLTLNATAGLAFSTGTGAGDASMTFSGTIADINAALDGLRFDPTLNYAGSTTLNVTTNDLGNTGAGGAKTDSRTIVINVSSVNTAPVLNGANNLLSILEDSLNDPGTQVFGLISLQTSDADAGALTGIAVTAVDNTNGAWQYSTDGASTWSAFGNPAASAARLLAADANTFVRFQPNANWNGTVSNGITFHAWDQTSGAAGGIADTAANGGTTAFSAAAASASIDVVSVNDAPIATGSASLPATLEDTLSPAGATVAAIFVANFSDVADAGDPAQSQFAGVAVRGEFVNAAQGRWQYSIDGGGTWANFGAIADANAFSLGASDRLRFMPAANFNGTPTDLSVRLIDNSTTVIGGATVNASANGGTTPFSAAIVMTATSITAVNDAPLGADATMSMLENTNHVFSIADFGFTDPADIPANGLLNVQIATLPAAGLLQDDGVNVTAGQLVSAADINAGKLIFTPAANASGAGYATFTFQVEDDGGTLNGGVDLDTQARTLTMNVVSVNLAPAGADNTVTTLEDAAYTFTAADFGFTDPDESVPNALMAVTLTTLPGAGSLTLSGVAVAAGQSVAVANITAGNLRFAPAANANGAGYATFTFQVQDDGGVANGGVDLDTTPRTMTVNVTAVNDAPVISGIPGTVSEAAVNVTTAGNQTEPSVATGGSGGYVVVWTSDGGQDGNGKGVFARRFDSAGNAQGAEFQVNTYVTGDQRQPAAGMDAAGNFVVVWTSNGEDGNANGVYGQRFDAAGNPLGGEFQISVTTAGNQDQPAIAVAADGSFVVAWSSDNGAARRDIFVRQYDASGAAVGGEVRVNTITTSDQNQPTVGIDAAGNFVVAWKTVDVVTGAGKGVSAQRFDSAGAPLGAEFQVNTFVAGDQDKPTIAVAADGRFVVAWSSNGQDGSGRGIYAQRFTAAGVAAGAEFRVNTTTANAQDVPSAAIDGAGNFVIAWASTAQDGAGKGIYAQRYDAAGVALGNEYRVNSTTAGNQDLPAIAVSSGGDVAAVWQGNGAGDNSGVFLQLDRGTASVLEDGTLVFSTANGNAMSVADVDAGAGAVQATLTATDGVVTLAGTAGLTFTVGDGIADVTVTFSGTVAAVNAALDGLSYAPTPNFNGRATLGLTVSDQGNTGVGGALAASNVIAISVIAVNDAPVGTSASVTVSENAAYIFSAADFGFTDPNDAPASALLGVTITALSGAGSLANNGVAVTAGQVIARADIDAGNLVFTPAVNTSGAAYAQFMFQVEDAGGTANGGADLDATPRTMTLDVAPLNHAPVLAGANDFAPIDEDAAVNGGTLVSALLAGRVTDADSAAASGIAVTAVDDSNGQWQYSLDGGAAWTAFGAPSAASARLLAADAGTCVRFVPNANWHGTVVNGISFNAWDQSAGTPGATADATATGGNTAFSALSASSSVTVNSVNDAPAGASNVVTTLEDTVYTFTIADFGLADASDSPANSLLAVEISAVPATGTLQNNGVDVMAGQFVAAADISAGKLVFMPVADANGAGYASFVFRVQDDGGVANGGADLEVGEHTMTVNVIAVNDAPAGADRSVTTLEGISYVFSVADFGFSDTRDALADAFTAVQITTPPGGGGLMVNGAGVTAGQVVSIAEIVAGRLVFTPATGASGNNYAAFTFQVQDNGGTANGGSDLDPVAKTLTVNVVATSTGPAVPAPVIVAIVRAAPAPMESTSAAPTPAAATPATATSVPAHGPQSTADAVAPPLAAVVEDGAAAARARSDAAAAGSQGSAGAAPAGVVAIKGQGLLAVQWVNVMTGDQPALLTAAGANTPADFKLAQVVTSAVQQPAFEHALDKARESVHEQLQQEERVVNSAVMGSTGLSVGYLLWLLRSGTLITSLLSSLPAWRTLDPFPVLSQLGDEEDDDDDDSLEALVANDSGEPLTPEMPKQEGAA